MSEPLAIVALLALALANRADATLVLPVLIALACVVTMHAVYSGFTHPTNRFWLEHVEIGGLSERFFGRNLVRNCAHGDDELWRRLRSRWERSHIVRAALGLAVLLSLLLSVAR